MRHLPRLAGLVVLAGLLLFPLFARTNYQKTYLMLVFLTVTTASAWNLIGGMTGYISLGHSFFFGVGAYTLAILLRDHRPALFLWNGTSPFLLALGGGLVAGFLGLVVGWIALRTRGAAFVVVTLALLLLGRLIVSNWSYAGTSVGINLPLAPWTDYLTPFYYVLLALMLTTIGLSHLIRRSKFGLGLIAIREDEFKAETSGIDTTQYKVLAFTISAFLVGTVGAVWGYNLTYINPDGVFSLTRSGDMILSTYIGGPGTVWGPVIGGTLLTVFQQWASTRFGQLELNRSILGLVLVIIVLFFPNGILGFFKAKRHVWRRWAARLGLAGVPAASADRRAEPGGQ